MEREAVRCLQSLLKCCIPDVKDVSEYVEQLRKSVKRIDEGEIEKRSRIFKALSDPVRLKILIFLSKKPRSVCEIMAALNLTQPNASYHLNMLESVGLVRSVRRGKWTFYNISRPRFISLLNQI